ncbi:hypothetical protein GCM10023093_20040 [Nemorincola caseinilytica]|uniref:7(1) septoil knot domain-containing protein n=1 Tax=Nemorincola caseinilytica TaxID=2054315 RepID=A0ABP8NEZ3_9BACT
MKKQLLSALLLCAATLAHAQRVYTTNNRGTSDLKVFVTDKASDADLNVYKVPNKYDAGKDLEEGLWYFTDHGTEARTRITFVDKATQADIQIRFVSSRFSAGKGWGKRADKLGSILNK